MNILLFGLIVFSVSCSSVAQVLLKTGMSQPAMSAALAGGSVWNIMFSIGQNAWVLGGLGLYFFGAIVWLFVLAKVEVSYAYPFVGLGFILTLLLGKLLLGDSITVARVFGTFLVTAGVILIARQ